MDEKQKKEVIHQAKKEAVQDQVPSKHLSWIPFIIAFAFMIPLSLWLYPALWVKMFLAIEIHANTILTFAGLVFAGAVFIKFDNWLRNVNKEISINAKNTNQLGKKLNETKNPSPDLYDVKLEPNFNAFAKRNRDFSSKSKVQYRHEKSLPEDDLSKLGGMMSHWGGSDDNSPNGTGTRYGGSKKSGRR